MSNGLNTREKLVQNSSTPKPKYDDMYHFLLQPGYCTLRNYEYQYRCLRSAPFYNSNQGSISLQQFNRFNQESMDNIVDAMNTAYQEFVTAVASTLEAKEASGGQVTAATDAALENLKQRWELFRVACDQAEEFVESVKLRIGSECLVDEATGSVAGKAGQPVTPGLPPISAVRLEQMSKAVRWLVIELQQGSGSAGNITMPQHSSAPFDARFHEDSAQ